MAEANSGIPAVGAPPPWLLLRGAPLIEARAAIVLVHGRGATAESIISLGMEIADPLDRKAATDVVFAAPQAPEGNQWYPYSFMAPLGQNEPHLSHALRRVEETLLFLSAAGVVRERILLVGFSQGACLALEALARGAERWAASLLHGPIHSQHEPPGSAAPRPTPPVLGGIGGLSGGLIGPPGAPRDYPGAAARALRGVAVFLGCSDVDAHIPKERVHETAQVLQGMGAEVTARLYPGMGHTVNDDELNALRLMWQKIKS